MVSGFRLEAKGNRSLQQEMDEWAYRTGLKNKYQNIARCLVRDGTTAVYLPAEKKGGIKEIEILPMKYITLLPQGITPGTSVNTLLKGEVEKIILNESRSTEHNIKHTAFERDETALFRIFHEGYFMKDNMGRETYGLYGVSMLEPVERPIKNLLDLNEGYATYMRRYGVGRLFINVPLIEQMRAEGRYGEAKDLLEDIIASQRKLAPNEDIIGGGTEQI